MARRKRKVHPRGPEFAALRRNRLPLVHGCAARPHGGKEDRFLATVFLGSGLLFLATTFASSAVTVR